MKKTLLISAALLLASLVFTGCDKKEEPPKPKEGISKDQIKEQAGKLLDMTKDFFEEQKAKYFNDLQSKMQDFNQKLDELQARAEKATPEMKSKLQNLVQQLQQKQEVAKKQLEESKGAVGQTWDDMKSKLDNTLKQMDQDLEKGKDI